MSDKDKERTPEEWDDEFEAIVDDPEQQPLVFYDEFAPIDPVDDLLHDLEPKYRSLREAYEAFRRKREEIENEEEE